MHWRGRRSAGELPEPVTTPHAHAREWAQNVVEYGLLLAMIALVVLLGTTAFGSAISPWFAALMQRLTNLT